jgi:predicted transcriptional regulator
LYRSKLQVCITILCALVSNGPLKLAQLTHKVELDKTNLSSVMGFLHDRGLVGEKTLDDEKAYFVTERGLSLLRVVAPLVKEAHRIEVRNFGAISAALSSVNSDIIKEKKQEDKKLVEWHDCSVVSQEKRSEKDFGVYLRSLFDNDPLKIKFRNPDAWHTNYLKNKT